MNITFSPTQQNLLVGCLLGDANLQTSNGQTWRARFLHKAVHLLILSINISFYKSFVTKALLIPRTMMKELIKLMIVFLSIR